MGILGEIISSLPDGKVEQVFIGLHWTAVVLDVDGERRCGLASTLRDEHSHHHQADIPQAGNLQDFSALQLASWVLDSPSSKSSVGMATINALLPLQPSRWIDANADELIAERGKGKKVALIGHFPFIDRLKTQVGELVVLELDPRPGDLPAHMASEVLPSSQVVAITGLTLLNDTLRSLLGLCPPQAYVILLGPSTPLSPVLFKYGIDLISGSVIEDIDSVLLLVAQGGNFRQVRRAGVRLVNIESKESVYGRI